MNSKQSSSRISRNVFEPSFTPAGKPTSQPGISRHHSTPSRSTSLFGSSQAAGRSRKKFSWESAPQPEQPPTNLFGNTAQTNNIFGSSTPQVSPPPGPFFGITPISKPTQSQTGSFSFGTSVSVTPTPISRSSLSQTSSYATPITPQSPSPAVGCGTPISFGKRTSASHSHVGSEAEVNVPPPRCYIDLEGDLCLVVGSLGAEFVVCSKTMARSSPFWKKMLYGDFAEGKKSQSRGGKGEWVVKLPEDNSIAMEIILNIIHGRFDRIPGYEDFVYTTHFYNLCVLTDKYDMTHILRPWARGWSRSTHSQCDKLGQSLRSRFCHERLWISWELGDRDTFEGMAQTLLLNSSNSPGNTLHYVGSLEPPGIYDSIKRIRLDLVKALLKPLDDIIQSLIRTEWSSCQCGHWGGKGACQAMTLGKAIQSLHRQELWPIPEPASVQFSVSELAAKLICVEFGDKTKPLVATQNCAQLHQGNLKAGIEKALGSIPSLLAGMHRRHLEAQAKKSGLALSKDASGG